MGEGDARPDRAAPQLGADTDALLRELLGYSDAQIAALRRAQAPAESD
jgi:crotonobetainyl-CoA:carnitine CoA-transferase CaiB-like acyl-CoA transferase